MVCIFFNCPQFSYVISCTTSHTVVDTFFFLHVQYLRTTLYTFFAYTNNSFEQMLVHFAYKCTKKSESITVCTILCTFLHTI